MPHMRMRDGTVARRERRRLRREVRLAGCALLASCPIVSACTLGWSNRPDRILACSISDPLRTVGGPRRSRRYPRAEPCKPNRAQPAIASPGAVVLSIEPAVAVPGTDTEAPVIFPGYVLPDDSLEDSTA